MALISQIIGWIGAVLVVLAYILVSNKKVTGTSPVYQAMNLIGALGVGVNAFYQAAWPSFAIQIVWGITALFALMNIARLKRKDA